MGGFCAGPRNKATWSSLFPKILMNLITDIWRPLYDSECHQNLNKKQYSYIEKLSCTVSGSKGWQMYATASFEINNERNIRVC